MENKKYRFKVILLLMSFLFFGQIKAQESNTTDSLINILPTYDNYKEKAKALFIISWSLQYSYPDSSIYYLNQVLELGRENNNDTTISGAYNRMGIAYDISNRWEESLEHYSLAIEYNKKTTDTITRGSIYSNRGLVYWNKSLYEKALEEFITARKLFESIEYKKGIANSIHNMALIQMDMNNVENATKYHEEALKIRTEINDLNGIIDSKTNLALLFRDKKEFVPVAKKYLYEAEAHYKLNNQNYALAKTYSHLAHFMELESKLDSSKYYLEKSIAIAQKIGALNFEASSVHSLSDVYRTQEMYEEEMKYLLQAQALAFKTNNLKQLGFIFGSLGNCNYNLGNYKTSSQNFQDSKIYRDSLLSIEKEELIKTLELRFETAKKENQITEQKLEIADKDIAISQKELEKSKIQNVLLMTSFCFYFLDQSQ